MTEEENSMMVSWFNQGVINYAEWVKLAVSVYKQRGLATLSHIEEIYSRYEFRAGVKETVRYLQDKNYHVALISSSSDIYVDKVAKDLGIEHSQSNNIFVFNGEEQLENVIYYGESGNIAKLRHLERFCRKLGLTITECACVGDGANDLEMFKASSHGITFKGSPIEQDAWQVIDTITDLQNIF